jgi:hypothetical protein
LAQFYELYLDQGTDFNHTISFTDDLSGNFINVSGYTLSAQAKKSYYSSNIYITFACTVNDAANGNISMSLDSANSSNIPDGNYVFDLKANTPANKKIRIAEGTIIVTPQVTI